MSITQGEEAAIVTALGSQVAQKLIDLLNAQGPAGPVVPPLVNHTQPAYDADADYSETIDGGAGYLSYYCDRSDFLRGDAVLCS